MEAQSIMVHSKDRPSIRFHDVNFEVTEGEMLLIRRNDGKGFQAIFAKGAWESVRLEEIKATE